MFTDESSPQAVSPARPGAALTLIEGGAVDICTIDGCGRERRAKGLCQMHYKRLRKTGTLDRYGVPADPHAGTAVKTCRRCKQVKPRIQFTSNAMAADGVKGRCRQCENELLREKYANDPKFREATTARNRRWKYKIEPAEVQALYELQGGLCGVCQRPLDGRFDVDHSHDTNEVRGLLHRKCNLVAGFFEQMDGAAAGLVLNYLQDPPMRRLAREKAI